MTYSNFIVHIGFFFWQHGFFKTHNTHCSGKSDTHKERLNLNAPLNIKGAPSVLWQFSYAILLSSKSAIYLYLMCPFRLQIYHEHL